MEVEALRADGTVVPIELTINRTDVDGEIRFTGFIRDQSTARAAEEALELADQRISAVVDAAPLMIFAFDLDGRLTFTRGSGLISLGLEPGDLVGHSVFDFQTDHEALGSDLERSRRGERFTVLREIGGLAFEVRYSPIRGAGAALEGAVAVALDVTERRRDERRMEHLAYYDQLTGLANRFKLEEDVERVLARDGRDGAAALLILDLDDFKTVNDSLGHEAGDEVLSEAGRRLTAAVDGHLVARSSGDSFLIFIDGLEGFPRAAAEAAARRAIVAFDAPFVAGGVEFQLGATVGLSLFPRDGDSFVELLRHAEVAMYRAKRHCPGAVAVYEPDADDARGRLTMTARLRRALARGEFTLHYQPIFTLPDRRPSALEALIRWEDPGLGTICPGDFIPAAESSGLIVEIGAWVADAACRQLAAWSRMGFAVSVSFNVSPVQLRSERFVDVLRATIERHAVDPALLIVEITESVAMDDVAQTTSVLRSLAGTGVGLVIDDFGAGHSSLTRLRHLAVGSLKIDRALMRDVDTDAGAATVVRATLALAQALDIKTVAEGVETEAQIDLLVEAGCTFAQGFVLARPLPAADATALLSRSSGPAGPSYGALTAPGAPS